MLDSWNLLAVVLENDLHFTLLKDWPILCVWVFTCVCMCTTQCLVPLNVRRGCKIPWNWSHKLLWAIMWALGTELRSCVESSKCSLMAEPFPASSSWDFRRWQVDQSMLDTDTCMNHAGRERECRVGRDRLVGGRTAYPRVVCSAFWVETGEERKTDFVIDRY